MCERKGKKSDFLHILYCKAVIYSNFPFIIYDFMWLFSNLYARLEGFGYVTHVLIQFFFLVGMSCQHFYYFNKTVNLVSTFNISLNDNDHFDKRMKDGGLV
jgi:hypothetical protein